MATHKNHPYAKYIINQLEESNQSISHQVPFLVALYPNTIDMTNNNNNNNNNNQPLKYNKKLNLRILSLISNQETFISPYSIRSILQQLNQELNHRILSSDPTMIEILGISGNVNLSQLERSKILFDDQKGE
jgi:hypothetical protein